MNIRLKQHSPATKAALIICLVVCLGVQMTASAHAEGESPYPPQGSVWLDEEGAYPQGIWAAYLSGPTKEVIKQFHQLEAEGYPGDMNNILEITLDDLSGRFTWQSYAWSYSPQFAYVPDKSGGMEYKSDPQGSFVLYATTGGGSDFALVKFQGEYLFISDPSGMHLEICKRWPVISLDEAQAMMLASVAPFDSPFGLKIGMGRAEARAALEKNCKLWERYSWLARCRLLNHEYTVQPLFSGDRVVFMQYQRDMVPGEMDLILRSAVERYGAPVNDFFRINETTRARFRMFGRVATYGQFSFYSADEAARLSQIEDKLNALVSDSFHGLVKRSKVVFSFKGTGNLYQPDFLLIAIQQKDSEDLDFGQMQKDAAALLPHISGLLEQENFLPAEIVISYMKYWDEIGRVSPRKQTVYDVNYETASGRIDTSVHD